jgi:hypothetical protein
MEEGLEELQDNLQNSWKAGVKGRNQEIARTVQEGAC